jgi:geranylgeranyl reductase family protein
MERADVLIVGGGPAGSACATTLAAAGRDVLVLDAAVFPRDKPCGGWITPEVLEEIPFSLACYAKRHVAQSISRFRVGTIEGRAVDVTYGRPVSYGIRRSEFDAELLRRSCARVRTGVRVRTLERAHAGWVVNGTFEAPVVVGAGGHFCPVARVLGGPADDQGLVVGEEIEFLLSESEASLCAVDADRPELYFCADLRGYGWCFRKGNYLNVGLGRLDRRHLSGNLSAFLDFLRREQRIGPIDRTGFKGHAYRVRRGTARRVSADGLLLVGDAAGLAAPASGEGILPALVSGRLAGESIVESRLADYERRLEEHFGARGSARRLPSRLAEIAGAVLLSIPGLARRLVLDRWFLHRAGAQPRASFVA